MTASRFARLMRAVEDAAALERDEAVRRITQTLADEPELVDEAIAVWEAGREKDGFLEPPAAAQAPRRRFAPGTRIGPFELLEPLGEGGMGTVFLARRESPRQHVALKLVRTALVSEAALQRFRHEVQALAALSHPNVAHVYDTGVHTLVDGPLDREVPWLAMEYVEGARPITAYAEAESLDTKARLALAATVCDAVHHGHQKGVVHRDLKPDNVLVDRGGRVKVIDFGIARVVDPELQLTTIQSSAQEIVGTLPYMCPEQVAGNALGDAQGDVYALGVMLFELLTGELPIPVEPGDFLTSARRICEEPPRRPSALRPELPRDVDAIVLKAVAKAPARRYGSAEALAADIRRHLAREPVLARAPTRLYHLQSFVRRHALLVASLAAVLCVAVVAAIVSIGFAIDADDSREQAELRTKEAEAERARAESLFETMLGRSMEATFRFAPRVHELPGGAEVASKLMAATLEDVRALEAEARSDPRARIALGEAWLKLGTTQGNPLMPNVKDYKGALKSYDRALEIAEELSSRPGTTDRALSLRARGRTFKAILLRLYGKWAEAKGLLEAALADHADLRPQHAREANHVGANAFTELILTNLFRTALEDPAAALPHARQAAALYREALVLKPASELYARGASEAHGAIGSTLAKEGDIEGALDALDQGAGVLAERLAKGDASVELRYSLAMLHTERARVHARAGDWQSEARWHGEALSSLLSLGTEDPKNTRIPPQVHATRGRLGDLHLARVAAAEDEEQRREHATKALENYRKALAYLESLPKKRAVFHAAELTKLRERIPHLEQILAPR